MPELPEVESFARALNASYKGKRIRRVIFRRTDIRAPLDLSRLQRVLRPRTTLEKFSRDGKQLIIETSRGKIAISLGMSGSFAPSDPKHPKMHEHVTFILSDGCAFGFIDPRRFGHIRVYETRLAHMADPLSKTSLLALFHTLKFRNSARSVKSALLDQKNIGGIGNIYALEALHHTGIRPSRRVSRVSIHEWKLLAREIPKILTRAIEAGGSTIATYRRLSNETGNFQSYHRVYERAGEQCLKRNCHGVIKRVTQSGRGSFYCPACQK